MMARRMCIPVSCAGRTPPLRQAPVIENLFVFDRRWEWEWYDDAKQKAVEVANDLVVRTPGLQQELGTTIIFFSTASLDASAN